MSHAALLALTLSAFPSGEPAAESRPLMGDPVHGAKLFEELCKSRYVETGVALFDSAELALLTDAQLYARIGEGSCVTDEQPEPFDASKLDYLDKWDVLAFIRTLHLNLADFFPEASRYVSKVYTIDEFGLKRVAAAASPLPPEQRSAPVFTFYDFEGEQGNLRFVPQDPIQLDQLKRDKKSGYLVFLPLKHGEFQGEVGIGMDAQGVITKLMVHPDAPGAAGLNAALSDFTGQGRLGQSEAFRVKKHPALSKAIFPLYMRAMETVTMFIREERDRTWAD